MEHHCPYTFFQMITRHIIKINFPKDFHRSGEWEYDVDNNNKENPLILTVWRDSKRKHPHSILLNEEDDKLVRQAIGTMEKLRKDTEVIRVCTP